MKHLFSRRKPYSTHKCKIGFAEDVELFWHWVMEGDEVDENEFTVEWFNYCPECGKKLK